MQNISKNWIKSFLSSILLSVMLLSNLSVFATGNVTPDVNQVIPTGWSYVVNNKEVVTPAIPQKLDFLLLVDVSWSYGDDIANIKALDDGIFDTISAWTTDFQAAAASFIDFPTSPYWIASDYPFLLNQDFTSDKTTWTSAITWLAIGSGLDEPESQYEALTQAANNATWRAWTQHVIVLTTDASFHDSDTDPAYPGSWKAATLAALAAKGIKVIALKAPWAGTQMDDIAAATGWSVLPTTSSSSDIADKIMEGLGNLPITVTPDASACTPLNLTFSPASQTVTSGDTASFVETINVPNNPALQWTSVSCVVEFKDENWTVVGRQTVDVKIPDTTAPVVQCVPTVNPAWKNIPKAWVKSPWQNEDWFYQLLATDNLDKNLSIYVNWFGAFSSGDKVKITEATWIVPSMKKMASSTDAVVAHLMLNTDAVVTVTDLAGNSSSVTCLVPRPPK